MPVLLAALLVPVVVYCLARAVAPRRWGSGDGHRRDVDAWHVLMAATMVAMLAGALTRPLAVASLAVATAGLCWGVLAVERRSGSSAHVRLVVGAAAMAVMTLPLAAPAEAAAPSRHVPGVAAMSMTGASTLPLVVVLLGALVTVAALRVPAVVRRSPGPVVRLDATCDLVMAGAMAAMLATLL
jgi:Domain of unknown function (DUF5134)